MKQALRLPYPEEMPLEVFLMDGFVACRVGDSELHYEPSDRVLRWRDREGQVVHASFAVRHTIHLQVNGPNAQAMNRGRQIEAEDIPKHRLEVTDEELLGLSRAPTESDVKRARRESAKLYHVDKHQQLEPGLQHVLNMRMKEQNAAAELEWTPILRHPVKTQISLNGDESHGHVTKAVHEGVQGSRREAAGTGSFRRRGGAGV